MAELILLVSLLTVTVVAPVPAAVTESPVMPELACVIVFDWLTKVCDPPLSV